MDSEWPAFPHVASGIFLTMRLLQVMLHLAAIPIFVNSIQKNLFGTVASFHAALFPTGIATFIGVATLTINAFGMEINPLVSAVIDLIVVLMLGVTMVFPMLKLKAFNATCDSLKSRGWDGCSLLALILALTSLAILLWIVTMVVAFRVWKRQRAFRSLRHTMEEKETQRAEQEFLLKVMHGEEGSTTPPARNGARTTAH